MTAGAAHELFVYVAPSTSDPAPVIGLYEALDRWQTPPTQIVLASAEELAAKRRATDSLWPRFSER